MYLQMTCSTSSLVENLLLLLLVITPIGAFVSTTLPPQQSYHHRRRHRHPISLSPMTTMSATTLPSNRVVCNNSSLSSCIGTDGNNDDITSTSITPRTTSSPSTTINTDTKQASSTTTKSKSKRLFSFQEARRIARGHGFDTYQEFIDYTCPGAYQLPKDADIVWKEEWKGWDDFLGLPLSFLDARTIARSLDGITTEASYLEIMENKSSRLPDGDDNMASRLPYRPDLKYKMEWKGWDDFLNSTTTT